MLVYPTLKLEVVVDNKALLHAQWVNVYKFGQVNLVETKGGVTYCCPLASSKI